MVLIWRSILVIIVGFLIGSVVNVLVVIVGLILIFVFEGVDMLDMDNFVENLKLFKLVNFIVFFVVYVFGMLVGVFVVVKIVL